MHSLWLRENKTTHCIILLRFLILTFNKDKSSYMHQSLLNINSINNTGRTSQNAAAFICISLISQRISISDGMMIVIQLIFERDRFQRILGVAPSNHNFFFRWGCWDTALHSPRCIWNNLLEIIFAFLILSSCVFFPNAAILSVCYHPWLMSQHGQAERHW